MFWGAQVLHTFRQICSCTSSMITCAVYMRSYASSLAGLESSLELQEHNVFVFHLPFLLLNQFPCNYDVSKCLINISVCFILRRNPFSTFWVLFCPRKEYLAVSFPFAIGGNFWFFFGSKSQTYRIDRRMLASSKRRGTKPCNGFPSDFLSFRR